MLRTSFQLVLGTHDTTPVPAAVRAHGFTHRFALVQSTHAPAVADMVVDSTALLVLLAAIDAHYGTSGRLFWDRPQRRRERIELATLAEFYRTTPPENHEPLAAAEWRQGHRVVALLHTEQWSDVGGPAPYHDSLTYSLYSAEDLSAPLLAALRAAGHEPTAIVRTDSSALPPARTRVQQLADTGFVAALACVVFTASLAAGAELFDVTPHLDPWLDFAGRWFAGPLALAVVYAAGYLIARRGRHPFTRSR